MQVLEAAIVVPVKDNQRTHGHARDNAIAAIGRMIRYQHANLDLNTVVYAWVKLLPLRFDKPEAKEAHDMLADMCMSNPEIVYGSDLSNLKHVVWLFADILEGKTVEEKTLPKIRTIIQGLQSQNVPQLTEIWAELTDVQRSKVSKLLG